MTIKHVLVPERVRQRRPLRFGWVDDRLIREGYLQRCDVSALALYLVLIIVADAQGLSFYADATLERFLSLPVGRLASARATLLRAGLIAWRAPIYQVLSLEPPPPPRVPGMRSVSTILEQLKRPAPESLRMCA